MKRTLLKTGDGSYTLHLSEWDEQYHSKNGAIAEALHVFIKEGLHFWNVHNSTSPLSILEIGFGTGLNCILTYLEAEKLGFQINYTGVEAFPLITKEAESLNYPILLKDLYGSSLSEKSDIQKVFSDLHETPWEQKVSISENFLLTKQKKKFSEIIDSSNFDLIYFDAFGIRVQPELWTEEIFQKMYDALIPGGILVTYAANGNARRAMQTVGFTVERLPGPPGKKEMLRAKK
ncbi:SAM-dependent methyltransferase [Aequorivita sp. H23M31]|uniref:SAM-dependent methyltransferase n=1 Tax=Aequorivita ciconiae TaxID=2494375 RepID=A0A410G121_9FLAO|nr:tRNA (5-methylaminomethyl-2-thiouridine)(34)-methyltransferase MnmD [Aequorivita sp. H23M31]QAA80972.1 SAM-dependent methyltransferase [Aequorivita sp. H23M31]